MANGKALGLDDLPAELIKPDVGRVPAILRKIRSIIDAIQRYGGGRGHRSGRMLSSKVSHTN